MGPWGHLPAALLLLLASGGLQQEAKLRGEAMYPLASAAVWDQLQAMVTDLGFRAEKRDEKRRILVTRWRDYDRRKFPDVSQLGLPSTDRPMRLQLHLMVPAGREPARVVVGSILEIERRGDGTRTTLLTYRPAAIDAWLFSTLDARLGARHELMDGTFAGRRSQAARLMPPGVSDPCLSTPASATVRPTPPVKISDVRPVFPAQGFASGEGRVFMNTTMTEHGTIANVTIPEPSAKFAHYETSARAAVGLWRFQPPMSGDCPLSTFFTIVATYSIR